MVELGIKLFKSNYVLILSACSFCVKNISNRIFCKNDSLHAVKISSL